MTGTGIIHSNNLQICLGVFRSRRPGGADTLRTGTHCRYPTPESGTGTRRGRSLAPHRRHGAVQGAPPTPPHPRPEPRPPPRLRSFPLFAFLMYSFSRGRGVGRGRDEVPKKSCGDAEGPQERAGSQAAGYEMFWGNFCWRCRQGVGTARGCCTQELLSGARVAGCRCPRSRVPVHMRTQSKRISEPPSLAATSPL